MLVLVWLLTVMLMMKSGAAYTKVINAQSGEAVSLTPDRQGLGHKQDVRWTHTHLVMSLKKNSSQCHHGRCELLRNGSLSFSHVQAEDSGNYSLEVFAEDGNLLMKSDFLLIVKGSSSSSSSSPGSTVAAVVSVLLCCFILVIFIFIFIKRKKGQNASATTDPLQENIYVVMHGDRGNKRKGEEEEEEEKKQEKEKQEEEEEESPYVTCNAVVFLETPTTPSVDAEDIYV